MRQLKRIALLALAGALLALAACGDDEGAPIPADTAAALQDELDGVQARIDNGTAGACRDILEGPRGPNLERVQQLLDRLPGDVDADVRSALEASFERLWELVQQDCEEKAAEEEAAEPEPAPVPEETVPEDTVPEETVPEEDEQPTDPEETPLPPEGDGDNDGQIPGEGNGGGVGPGASGSKRKKGK